MAEANLISTFINKNVPYDGSIEIKNTDLWAKSKAKIFYIQIVDRNGRAGNVTVRVVEDFVI